MGVKIVTAESIKAAYELLRVTAFKHIKLPTNIKFIAKKLKDAHGYYRFHKPTMWVDTQTKTLTKLLQIVAHETIHAILDQNADCDHDLHDDNFKALARIAEHEMGWPKGSV